MYINQHLSQINNIQSYNGTSFNAKLKLSGNKLPQYLKNNEINTSVAKELCDKFEKATKEIDGTLEMDFGSKVKNGELMSRIRYSSGKNDDEIKVFLENEKLSSDDKFVNKLVKMLDIFKMREKNFQKVKNLKKLQSKEVDLQKYEKRRFRIYNLRDKNREDTRKATIELFDMPYSSGTCTLGL